MENYISSSTRVTRVQILTIRHQYTSCSKCCNLPNCLAGSSVQRRQQVDLLSVQDLGVEPDNIGSQNRQRQPEKPRQSKRRRSSVVVSRIKTLQSSVHKLATGSVLVLGVKMRFTLAGVFIQLLTDLKHFILVVVIVLYDCFKSFRKGFIVEEIAFAVLTCPLVTQGKPPRK